MAKSAGPIVLLLECPHTESQMLGLLHANLDVAYGVELMVENIGFSATELWWLDPHDPQRFLDMIDELWQGNRTPNYARDMLGLKVPELMKKARNYLSSIILDSIGPESSFQDWTGQVTWVVFHNRLEVGSSSFARHVFQVLFPNALFSITNGGNTKDIWMEAQNEATSSREPTPSEVLAWPAEQLPDLTTATCTGIRMSDFATVEELVEKSRGELLGMGFEVIQIDEIATRLRRFSLWLGMKSEEIASAKLLS